MKYELRFKEANMRPIEVREPTILNQLYRVEYGKDSFRTEASFTLLDWIISDKIQKDPYFDLNDIDIPQKIQLCFNIFPKCQTILHKLAMQSDDANDSSSNSSSDIT